MKGFNTVDGQVGFGDANNSFGISPEGINEPVLPFIRHGSIQCKSIISGDIDENIAGLFVVGD